MIEAVGIPKPKLFPSKGGNMALPQTPRPPDPHPLILKFILLIEHC